MKKMIDYYKRILAADPDNSEARAKLIHFEMREGEEKDFQILFKIERWVANGYPNDFNGRWVAVTTDMASESLRERITEKPYWTKDEDRSFSYERFYIIGVGAGYFTIFFATIASDDHNALESAEENWPNHFPYCDEEDEEEDCDEAEIRILAEADEYILGTPIQYTDDYETIDGRIIKNVLR